MIHLIESEIYPIRIWVDIGSSVAELKDYFTDTDFSSLRGESGSVRMVRCKLTQKSGWLIRLSPERGIAPHVIAHEAAHVAIHLFYLIQAEVSRDNSEPFCYFLSWLIKEIWKLKDNNNL